MIYFNKKFIIIFSLFFIVSVSFFQKFYFIEKHFIAPDDTFSPILILDEKLFSGTYLEKKENLFTNRKRL